MDDLKQGSFILTITTLQGRRISFVILIITFSIQQFAFHLVCLRKVDKNTVFVLY